MNESQGRPNEPFGYVLYVYLGEGDVYVGQTDRFMSRNYEHYHPDSDSNIKAGTAKMSRADWACSVDDAFDKVAVIFGSAITRDNLDIGERLLISCVAQDNSGRRRSGRRRVLNDTRGNRARGRKEFMSEVMPDIWRQLHELGYVREASLESIRQGSLFRYSPFTDLNAAQQRAVDVISSERGKSFVVRGAAGTGKSVLMTCLAARIADLSDDPSTDVAVLCKSNVHQNMVDIFDGYGVDIDVLTPVSAADKGLSGSIHYKTVVVDEAHRLPWTGGHNHPTTRKRLNGLARKYGVDNELEYLEGICDQLVLLYDPYQAVRSEDIPRSKFFELTVGRGFAVETLSQQMRIDPPRLAGMPAYKGDDYARGIAKALGLYDDPSEVEFDPTIFRDSGTIWSYFGVVDSIQGLFDYLDMKESNDSADSNRVLSGYYKKWLSNPTDTRHIPKASYDPKSGEWSSADPSTGVVFDWDAEETGGLPRRWNEDAQSWAHGRSKAKSCRHRQEIGSIHAVQGEDLGYVGVIVGRDIAVGEDGLLHGVETEFFDANAEPIKDRSKWPEGYSPEDFQRDLDGYIKDAYYTLLTRAVKGVRLYFVDKRVREYFESVLCVLD
jgi:DUF2075 family protein